MSCVVSPRSNALRWSAGRPSKGTRHWWRMVLREKTEGCKDQTLVRLWGIEMPIALESFDHFIRRLRAEVF